MAATRQYFYKLDGSDSSVSVAVKIFQEPGTIRVVLDNVPIGTFTDNLFPSTEIGSNQDLKGKTLMVITNVEDFNPDTDDATVEVSVLGGVKDRVIDEPVTIPTNDSVFLVFFITFI